MELVRFLPKQRPSLRSIFWSFIGLWVKIWHRNETTSSKSNPVQSSRSKLTTCPRKGRLLRFELNSTATLNGSAYRSAKAWKRRLVWFLIDCNQSLQPIEPNRSRMNCNLSQERESAQIWIEQHSNFRWLRAKGWKWCLVWFWIDNNQNLQPNW